MWRPQLRYVSRCNCGACIRSATAECDHTSRSTRDFPLEVAFPTPCLGAATLCFFTAVLGELIFPISSFVFFLLCLFFHLQQQLGSSGDVHFVRQKRNRHLCRSCHRRVSELANCYTSVTKFLKLHIAGLFRLGLFLGLATNGPIWMHGFIPTPSPLRLGLGIITVTIIGQLVPWS